MKHSFNPYTLFLLKLNQVTKQSLTVPLFASCKYISLSKLSFDNFMDLVYGIDIVLVHDIIPM